MDSNKAIISLCGPHNLPLYECVTNAGSVLCRTVLGTDPSVNDPSVNDPSVNDPSMNWVFIYPLSGLTIE